MARGVGIEVNGTRVRALAVEGGKKPRILAFTEQPILADGPWEDRARDAVKAAVVKIGGLRGRVSASIDTGEVIIRELQLPFKGDDQIRKTVRFELESLVHNYAIEDLVVDYMRTAETDKGVQLLVAGVPRKLIEDRLKLLGSAGADPAMIELDSMALFNALNACGAVTQDEPFLVAYGSSRFTKFLLVENRRPKSIRTIRFSMGHAPVPAPPSNVSLTESTPGNPSPIVVLTESQWEKHTSDVPALGGELVDILARELSRFLLSSAEAATPTHIYLVGDLDPDTMAAPLAKATGIPVKSFDFFRGVASVSPPDPSSNRKVGVSLGLALKSVDIDHSGIDFRRDEFSYSKKFDPVKSTGMVTVYLVLMFLGLVALFYYFKSDDLQKDLAELYKFQVEVAADAVNHNREQVPDELQKDPTGALKFLKDHHAEMSRIVGAGDHPIERSAVDLAAQVWRALVQFFADCKSQTFENQTFYASIDSVVIKQNPAMPEDSSVVIEGVIRNSTFANELKKKLVAVEPFSAGWKAESGPTSTDKDNVKFQFTLKREKAKK